MDYNGTYGTVGRLKHLLLGYPDDAPLGFALVSEPGVESSPDPELLSVYRANNGKVWIDLGVSDATETLVRV